MPGALTIEVIKKVSYVPLLSGRSAPYFSYGYCRANREWERVTILNCMLYGFRCILF